MTFFGQFKLSPTVILALMLCGGTGALAINWIGVVDGPPRSAHCPPIGPSPAGPTEAAAPRTIKVPSEFSGRLLGIFCETSPFDSAAENDIIIVGEQKYRKLRESDTVKEGQLLARVNDILARDELDLLRAK
jgi:multidrug efflux pump subunit AcrA (membrane-fusion protein)